VSRAEGTDYYGSGVELGLTETRVYDASGRITDSTRSGQHFTFGYESDTLKVASVFGSTITPLSHVRLNDRGAITEWLDSPTHDSIEWLDDLRPLAFTDGSESQQWSWDSEGFLLGTSRSDPVRPCGRRFAWDRRDRVVALVVRDAHDRVRFSVAYEFDSEGRMTRVASSGSSPRAWSYHDGWATESDEDGHLFRANAACHYPPTRKDLSRALAAAMWSPPNELRPDHLHRLNDLPIPGATCVLGE
jgi:hypothetical protein